MTLSKREAPGGNQGPDNALHTEILTIPAAADSDAADRARSEQADAKVESAVL